MLRLRVGQIALPVLTALIAGTNVGHAETYTYSSYSVPGEENIQITSPHNIFGGMGQIDLVGTGSNDAGHNILAWCLDVYTYLLGNGYGGSGPFTYNISQLTNTTENVGFSTDGTNTSAMLTTNQIEEIGGLIAYGDANVGTAHVSAATQLAIWEIEYGQSVFQFTDVGQPTIDVANWEISQLDKTIALDPNVGLLTQGTDEANQTLAYLAPGGGGQLQSTPLPASLPLFITGAGILGFAGTRRRKRAATKAAV